MGWPSSRYVINPDDPRAPPQEVWDAMSDAERADVLANLPSKRLSAALAELERLKRSR